MFVCFATVLQLLTSLFTLVLAFVPSMSQQLKVIEIRIRDVNRADSYILHKASQFIKLSQRRFGFILPDDYLTYESNDAEVKSTGKLWSPYIV